MSFFNNILEKLGLKKNQPTATAATPAAKPADYRPTTTAPARPVMASTPAQAAPTSAPAKPVPTPVSEVDVVKKLDQLSKGSGLDWKVSIVDLLKLLEIDSSLAARKELAVELGCPADLMSDSAKMNVWLHKTVLKKIAENGGNIPQSLLS